MVAKSVVDVILGEAVAGSDYERFEDMVAIASVIQNRANQYGVSPDSVIAGDGQFDAYGKALPSGVESKRALAEAAWKTVQQAGPMHNATFYATREKSGNLPRGLVGELQTKGHVFRSDPQNRPVITADGVKRFAGVTPPPYAPVPSAAPPIPLTPIQNPYEDLVPSRVVPSTGTGRTVTPGAGLANLAPNGLAGYEFKPGPKRPGTPDPSITNVIREAVTDVLGPGARVVGHSGVGKFGSNRHRTSFAEDVQVYLPDGTLVSATTHPEVMRDIGRAAAARGATGIGFGSNYMGGNSLHLDRVAAALPGHLDPATQDAEWGNYANAMAGELAFARETGIGPTPNEYSPGGIPTPTPRDTGLNLPSVPTPAPSLPNFSGGMSPRAAQQSSMAMYGLGLPPSPPPSVPALPYGPETTQAIPAAMTRPGTQGAPMSVPAAPPQMPSIPQSVMDGYRDYGASRALAPASEFPALPAFAPVPAPAPMQIAAPDLPVAAPIPTPAPRNSEAAFLGGILGPATKQIGQNVKTNMQGGRINVLAGIPQAYRDAFRGLGNRIDRMFGGSLPPPTPFSVGRGSAAIQSVMGGGQKPGATAYSNSHPGASWSVNAYGLPEFTSQHGFTGRTPDGF